MALNAAAIKTKLGSVSWTSRDDEARNMINNASAAELKSLDAEAVLRLHDAMRGTGAWYSADDKKAMQRLAAETQFQPVKTPDFAVDIIKKARPGQAAIQSELSVDLVNRIYAAENKRLSLAEKAGFDGDTVGRGQLGQPAYTDVGSAKHFKAELEKIVTHNYISKILAAPTAQPAYEASQYDTSYKFRIPTQYSILWRNPVLEDFVVAAYLAIRIEAAAKRAGRSAKDAARFAVALYHGMFDMVSKAQTAVSDDINWAPVETHLRAQGNTDECDYVNEVVK